MSYPFFVQSISKMRQVGSIIPSSRFLTASMCGQVDFTSASLLVELGPGTGVLTQELLSKMTRKCQLLCIELNPAFAQRLSNELDGSQQARVIEGNAENLSEHLSKRHWQHEGAMADCIISSLPLYNMPIRVKLRILRACRKSLRPGGLFIQYQYSIADKKLIKRYFSEVKTDFVLLNIPPAFVYSGKK